MPHEEGAVDRQPQQSSQAAQRSIELIIARNSSEWREDLGYAMAE